MPVKLGDTDYTPHYADPKACELWFVAVRREAARTYNPYPEIYDRIKFLPDADRAVAVQEMMRGTYPVTKEWISRTLFRLDFIQWLAVIVLGCSFATADAHVTEANKDAIFAAVNPYLKKQWKEITVEELKTMRKAGVNP